MGPAYALSTTRQGASEPARPPGVLRWLTPRPSQTSSERSLGSRYPGMSFLKGGNSCCVPPGAPRCSRGVDGSRGPPQCRRQRSLPAAGVPRHGREGLHLYGQALLLVLRLCHTWPRGPACREGSRGGRWRPDRGRPGALLGRGHAPPLPRAPGGHLTKCSPAPSGDDPLPGRAEGRAPGPNGATGNTGPSPPVQAQRRPGASQQSTGGSHVQVQPPMGLPGSA